MTREFFRKVLKARILDTRRYRYIVKECGEYLHIERISISMLGKVEALNNDNWQVVAVYA